MGIVIYTAARGRHIVEAISWGLIVAFIFNIVLGLASVSDMIVFEIPEGSTVGQAMSFLPFVQLASSSGVSGSIYEGAVGFFSVIVLMLLILSAAQVMSSGGAFELLLDWSLDRVATSVRGAELTMAFGTIGITSVFTISTASEIAIAPYVANIGERFNIHSYRRANILDGCTAGIAYLFPWSGAVLGGIAVMQSQILPQYEWFTPEMIVNPAFVFPFVFHCWLLLFVFLGSAWTGFGREYLIDRPSGEVSRV
jgi:Na+/H+ antiporter NhaC